VRRRYWASSRHGEMSRYRRAGVTRTFEKVAGEAVSPSRSGRAEQEHNLEGAVGDARTLLEAA
jgi:hypothetical protein